MATTDELNTQIVVTKFPTDRESLERDCDVEFFVAGGPGGQHRNKVETGVRLTHGPSGLVVTATERRSQSANREAAFERMAEKLEARQKVQKPRRATKPSGAAKQKRIQEKKKAGERKKARGKVKGYED
ncbi:MAG TPA: peptide chain release factor-like protein [Blastocatellia bacterium]|nr:peptide chain release factor-like protein [Blastocatellia bacterium]